MGGKFQVHASDLEYLFWQCEKHIELSEKKPFRYADYQLRTEAPPKIQWSIWN